MTTNWKLSEVEWEASWVLKLAKKARFSAGLHYVPSHQIDALSRALKAVEDAKDAEETRKYWDERIRTIAREECKKEKSNV